ncbi:MAG: FAD/NAD(P)-binding protein [Myxococcales bacterium]|nr:FAD/NAD(P)-binding protein [Myxococcales bacterium]
MIGWAVVGAGPQGVAVAVHLVRAGVPAEAIRLLDPHPPLTAWRTRAARVGMRRMRSPATHHLDVADDGLLAFGARHGQALRAPSDRPERSLFEAHARWLLTGLGVGARWLAASVRDLQRHPASGWQLHTDTAPVHASRVVLALGSGQRGRWPRWARALRQRHVAVHHVLELQAAPTAERMAVVGGGLSAVQAALRLAHAGHAVWLLARRRLRVRPYDVDAPWFDDGAPWRFARLPSSERPAALAAARHPGTVPAQVARRLLDRLGEGAGRIRFVAEPVVRATPRGGGVRLHTPGHQVDVGGVWLATGFDPALPHGGWVPRVARALGLPITPSGHPVLDRGLSWAPGLHVTGALAELQLGPAARGLIGGRWAARRIADHHRRIPTSRFSPTSFSRSSTNMGVPRSNPTGG